MAPGHAEQVAPQGVVAGRFGTARWFAPERLIEITEGGVPILPIEFPERPGPVEGGEVGFQLDRAVEQGRGFLGPPLFAVEVGQGDVGVEPRGVDGDGLAEVGHRFARAIAFEPDQAAVDPQGVAELLTGAEFERLAEVGLGILERLFRLGLVRLRRGDLAAGEPAEQVEPGEVGVAGQAVAQRRLGHLGPRRAGVQFADGRKAEGPEVIGLEPQRGVEVPLRPGQRPLLEPLPPEQEVIERVRRLEPLGFDPLARRPRLIPRAGQAGRAPEVIGRRGERMDLGRGIEDPQRLPSLSPGILPGGRARDRLGQHEQEFVRASGHVVALRGRQRVGQGGKPPGAGPPLGLEHGQGRADGLACGLGVIGQIQAGEVDVADDAPRPGAEGTGRTAPRRHPGPRARRARGGSGRAGRRPGRPGPPVSVPSRFASRA